MSKYVVILTIAILAIAAQAGADGLREPIHDHYEILNACLDAVNKQINEELHASMVYMNMAGHFNGPRVARYGFGEFFRSQSLEEYKHAQLFMDYVNLRNGTMGRIGAELSPMHQWNSVKHALEDAIELEKSVYSKIQLIHSISEHKCQDWHLMDFLESKFFTEQVESINELYSLLSLVNSAEASDGSAIGEYLVDQQVVKMNKKKAKEEL